LRRKPTKIELKQDDLEEYEEYKAKQQTKRLETERGKISVAQRLALTRSEQIVPTPPRFK